MPSLYDELDDEELYVLDEDRYNQKMEEQKKERVERLKKYDSKYVQMIKLMGYRNAMGKQSSTK